MDVDIQVGEGDPGTGPGPGAGVGAGVGAGAGADLGVDVGVDAGVKVGVDGSLDTDLGPGPGSGAKPGAGPGVKSGEGAGLKPGVKPGPGTTPKPKALPKSYPVKIAVNNVPEGVAFIPNTKKVPVSEDPKEIPKDSVITVFAAVDPDTGKPAEDVSYAKAYDPGNWFTIDEETAEIKLNTVPDRESPFLVNGTYIAKILAISKDMPTTIATGTIVIQVTDSNDHCPTLTTTHGSLCSDERTVYFTGSDEDVRPNAASFTFRIILDGTQGSWDIEVINETTAAVHAKKMLWPGSYELHLEVADAQGVSCPAEEGFTVHVCTCVETKDCSLQSVARVGGTSSALSAPAIGLLLTSLCLLLFIPLLLLFCQCGGADTIFPDQFNDLPFDAKDHLISYHTEGRGEDKELPLQSIPVMLGMQRRDETASALNSNIPSKIAEAHQTATFYSESVQKFQESSHDVMELDNTYRFSGESFNHGSGGATFSRQTFGTQNTISLYEDMALPYAFLSDYYSQKAACNVPVKDGVLEYELEDEGSSAGLVDCCSLLESNNDLQFLDDLGPKFKTLAEICSPPAQKTSLTYKTVGAVKTTVDIAKPLVKPMGEHAVETTQHSDTKAEKVMSAANISKSSASTVSAAPQSMTLPRPKVTNSTHSSNISPSATLPPPSSECCATAASLHHHQPCTTAHALCSSTTGTENGSSSRWGSWSQLSRLVCSQ
uniref:Cadherin domain-containing protein n=1 Tax=Monopterus albus TaxID=43700 RepID=A0A3Q3QFA6_MONAL|nr:desmoglein-2-like [Monopterus albus]